jgi:hypothetical protein
MPKLFYQRQRYYDRVNRRDTERPGASGRDEQAPHASDDCIH